MLHSRSLAVSLVAAGLLVYSGSAADVRSVWIGPIYGSWSEPTNWLHTPVLPGVDYPHNDTLTYDVEITNGYAIIPPGPAFTIDGLTLAGGTLHSDYNPLTIREPVLWSDGSFFGLGTVIASNGILITGTGPKSISASSLKLYGASIFNSSNVVGGGFWQNQGSFELQSDGIFPGDLINEGPVRKTGGAGTNFFQARFESKTELEIQTGSVVCSGWPANISGRVHISAGSTLVSGGGSFGLHSSNVAITGRGLLRFHGGFPQNNVLVDVESTADLDFEACNMSLAGLWTMQSNSVATVRAGTTLGPGCLLVSPGCALNLNQSWIDGGLCISNLGLVRFAGTLDSTGFGRFYNRGLLEITNDVRFFDYESDSFIENQTLIRKSAGTHTAVIGGLNVNNRGLVEVLSGTLRMAGGGTNSGTFRAALGTMLELGNEYGFYPTSNPLFAEGTVFEGEGTNRISSPFARVSGHVTNSGLLDLYYTQLLDNGGPQPGVLHNESNATCLLGPGFSSTVTCVISNVGALKAGGFTFILGNGRIENAGQASIVYAGGIYGGPFNNRGVLRKVAGGDFEFKVEQGREGLNNSGLCSVEAGTMYLESRGTSSGTFIIASNSTLRFQIQTNTLTEGANLTGPGSVFVEAAVAVEGNVTNEAALMLAYPGRLRGSGRLVVNGPGLLMWGEGHLLDDGVLEVRPSAKLEIQANTTRTWIRRTINNHGLASFTTSFVDGHDGVFNNYGLLGITNGCWFRWDGTGAPPLVNNFGTMAMTGGYWTEFPGSLTNSGVFLLQNARIDLPRFENSGDASVMGTMNCAVAENRAGTMLLAGVVAGWLTNNSVLEIGTNIGTANCGQLYLTSASIINLDIGGTNAGTSYDQIVASADVWLNGVLNIRLTNNFQPVLGQRFTILRYNNNMDHLGFFSRIHGLNIGNGLRLVPTSVYRALELVVAPATSPGQVPMMIRQTDRTHYAVSWPPGFAGFYFQSTTNLATASWETLWINQGDSFEWSTGAVIYPETEPRYNQPQRFFRLFDPDSP